MADVRKDSVSSAASKSSSTGKSSSSGKDSSKPAKHKQSRPSIAESSSKPSVFPPQGTANARKASTSSTASKSSLSGRSASLGKDSTNPTKRKQSRPSIAESSSKRLLQKFLLDLQIQRLPNQKKRLLFHGNHHHRRKSP
ncbi:uncharacterized protein LOC142588627 [Dermacentor variabilis]|uniref:uncharacterized protein LOC142588627 n=1 Tax=Dermacentor variabilis TaxID=34621 RepID=UPI003F5BD071